MEEKENVQAEESAEGGQGSYGAEGSPEAKSGSPLSQFSPNTIIAALIVVIVIMAAFAFEDEEEAAVSSAAASEMAAGIGEPSTPDRSRAGSSRPTRRCGAAKYATPPKRWCTSTS